MCNYLIYRYLYKYIDIYVRYEIKKNLYIVMSFAGGMVYRCTLQICNATPRCNGRRCAQFA